MRIIVREIAPDLGLLSRVEDFGVHYLAWGGGSLFRKLVPHSLVEYRDNFTEVLLLLGGLLGESSELQIKPQETMLQLNFWVQSDQVHINLIISQYISQ